MSEVVGGYKLECYQKLMPLGEKGNLWVVEDSVTRKRFAMRKLPLDFLLIYQKLAGIHHENIVEIVDVFLYGDALYVIEEYLAWELLSEAAKRTSFSSRQVRAIGRQLFRALSVLHGEGVIHRDIKPENLMINMDGKVKLIDFDIARLFVKGKSGDTTLKGSRDYAPPEQFGFAQTDPRTDIYALGVTLNELAVGELPEQKTCRGVLGAVVKRCTEFDPKRRYQSASQALIHMRWMERKSVLSVSVAILFTLVLFVAGAVFILTDSGRETEQEKRESAAISGNQEPKGPNFFPKVDALDRIVFVREPDRYPALLISEDGSYEYPENPEWGLPLDLLANKKGGKLSLTCKEKDGGVLDFEFEDVGLEIYEGWYEGSEKHVLEKELEGKLPEYEILFHDLDGNGTTDLMVTLAKRRLVETPDPKNRYYLTAYAVLWVVYRTETGWDCSEPLFFPGYGPSLETDRLLFNDKTLEWYGLKNGIWVSN